MKQTLGQRLKARRVELGLTHRDVCKISGVAFSTIQQIESGRIGKPGFHIIRNIAKALELPLDELSNVS